MKGRRLARFLGVVGVLALVLGVASGIGLVAWALQGRCLDLGSVGGGIVCDDTGGVAPTLAGVSLALIGLVTWGALRALALILENPIAGRDRSSAIAGTDRTVVLPPSGYVGVPLPPSPPRDGSRRYIVVVHATGPSLRDLADGVARELRKDPAYVRSILKRMPAVVVRDVDEATARRVMEAIRAARGSGRAEPMGGRVESTRPGG